ncbi:hypothetical protein ACF0H5_023834 [Mactra antiquata]
MSASVVVVLLFAFLYTASADLLGTEEVAFSAGITSSQTLHNGERVAFDSLYTNIGSAYDTNTGIFNCPFSGIYLFQVHTMASQDKSSWLELYHNSYYIFSLYGHSNNEYGAASNSVILRLSKGDQVYVRSVNSKYGASTDIYGQVDEIYSTFSGYLLSPVYEDIINIG